MGPSQFHCINRVLYFDVPFTMLNTIILSPDSEIKPVYHNKKTSYKRQRSQRDYPIKKRILYDRSSVSNFDGGVSREGISSSPRKGFSFGASCSAATVHGGLFCSFRFFFFVFTIFSCG